MDDLVIRKARESDHSEVVRISEGNRAGFDILPACFKEYLQTPHRHIYVAATRDDKLVTSQQLRSRH